MAEHNKRFRLSEVDSIYVDEDERYVVSLIVGYAESDFTGQSRFENSPAGAAEAALDLTRDAGSSGTVWCVYDRTTGKMHKFEQSDFDTGSD